MGRPLDCSTPAGAFVELCHSKVPYLSDTGGPEPYFRENVSLPDSAGPIVSCDTQLRPAHRELVVGENARMLENEHIANARQEHEGVTPFVEPSARSPKVNVFFT